MRRGAVGLVAILAVALPAMPLAQQAGKTHRIGVLTVSPAAPDHPLREALREFGYVEGRNLTVDWRSASGDASKFAAAAAEIVRLGVEVIVAPNNPAIQAALRATKTIPIVMVAATDPVGLGFVTSLARPGGNITGLTIQSTELVGKHLELLKEAIPKVSRVAVLWDPREPGRQDQVRAAEIAAPALGLQLELVEVRSPSDLDGAFAMMRRDRIGAVLVLASTMQYVHRAQIAELAAKSRLPTICAFRESVVAGCLMSYLPNQRALFQRAAMYVDKLLKGAKPGELPVEQPTKFELVINMKTAKALGLTIPPSVLLRADQVLE